MQLSLTRLYALREKRTMNEEGFLNQQNDGAVHQ